jgi:Domain of unknown function (DUF4328)
VNVRSLDASALADLTRSCNVASHRARFAIGGVVVTSVVDSIPQQYFGAEAATSIQTAALICLLVTGVLFLRWLHRALANALPLRSAGIRWRPADCVTGFIIPIISLYRPFQIVRDLNEVSDPSDLLLAPVLRERAGAGYRSAALEVAPPPKPTPGAPVGLWWALWIGNNLLTVPFAMSGPFGMLLVVAMNASLAATAIVVMTRIDNRQRERLRRLSATAAAGG